MTIKELELKSGIDRSNIRFYENEGLINPAKEENGYRSYSDEDLKKLQKIVLLRKIGLSIKDIKLLDAGLIDLQSSLKYQLDELERKQTETLQSKEICKQMISSNQSYIDLDAALYLDCDIISDSDASFIAEDSTKGLIAPWRRFFARITDMAWINIVIWTLLSFARINILSHASAIDFLVIILSVGLTIIIEPIFLSLFATTPGKAIMGITVTDLEGKKLSFENGMTRTLWALWYGMGARIPIFAEVRAIKSFKTYKAGNKLSWEDNSELVVKDKKIWRLIVIAILIVAQVTMLYGLSFVGARPRVTGNLSIEDFVWNYNSISSYYNFVNSNYLGQDGKWTQRYNNNSQVVITIGSLPPDFQYEMEDGHIKKITFYYQYDPNKVAPAFDNILYCASLALASSLDSYKPLSKNMMQLRQALKNNKEKSFTFSCDGFTVRSVYISEQYISSQSTVTSPAITSYYFELNIDDISD